MRAEGSMRRVVVTILIGLTAAVMTWRPEGAQAQATEFALPLGHRQGLHGAVGVHGERRPPAEASGRRSRCRPTGRLQGFGMYTYGQEKNKTVEEGRYRHRFDVPCGLERPARVPGLEGAMTDTEIAVNGRSAGPVHRGGFYEFRREITPLVRAGRSNLLEVTVREHSSNASVNRAERDGDFWVLGGIYRPVRIEAVPQVYLERVAIDARADGAFTAVVPHRRRAAGCAPDGTHRDTRRSARGRTVHRRCRTRRDSGHAHDACRRAAHLERGDAGPLSRHLHADCRRPHAALDDGALRVPHVRSPARRRPVHQRAARAAERRQPPLVLARVGRTTSREVSVGDVSLMKDMNAVRIRTIRPTGTSWRPATNWSSTSSTS